jgi:hypothetical protein
MLSFRRYLHEARRNSHLSAQKRENALQRLEKWSNDSKIHISYTAIRKIGINPKSKFIDTPLAVYSYPLKEVWGDIKNEGVRNVRFAANTSKFIFVLQETGSGLKDVSSYTKGNLKSDLKKIRSMVPEETYVAAEKDVENTHGSESYLPYRYLQYFIYRISLRGKRRTTSGYAAEISKILSQLGYNGFSDRKGTGQIHQAEEIQSFFISPKAYKVVDVIEIKDIDIKDERIRDMADYLKKNARNLSDDEIIKIVWKDFSLARYMGPPRTEVLKVFMDKKQAERWKSKQSRNDDPDYDGDDYVPAEGPEHGARMIFNYKKLPDEFLEWGVSHSDRQTRSIFSHWMKQRRYRPSDSFIQNIVKNNPSILEFAASVSRETAREVIKHHGYADHLSLLSQKMKENDLFAVLGEIRNFDPFKPFGKYEPVAKFLYKRLLDKRNPSDDDISEVARYVQSPKPSMAIVNGLKKNFPDYDFTQVGGWDYWKR